uniref:Uncharacterized protein n=1 Tax=Meloidogyne enterolobii TaxID=390850 RepID=A0A6V7VMU8_MELEN|nr:unnamed protein product [Meloidogyne enterolobii]
MATGNQCNLTPSTKFPHQWKLFNSLDKTTASKQQLGPKLYKIQTVFGDVLGLGTQNFRIFVINLIFSSLPTHAVTRWTTLSKVITIILEKWDPLFQLFENPTKPRLLRDFFQSENSKPICYFLQNVLKIFNDAILTLQRENMLLPDLIEVMEGFKAKIEARLNGDGNSGNSFFGGYFTLRRATPEQETEFCNFYKIVLNYIERWFQLQLLPKGISIINLENKELIYAEVVQLAEQICPENSENDELFDEVSQLNKTLNGINNEGFYLKTTEQKWKMIFDVPGFLMFLFIFDVPFYSEI